MRIGSKSSQIHIHIRIHMHIHMSCLVGEQVKQTCDAIVQGNIHDRFQGSKRLAQNLTHSKTDLQSRRIILLGVVFATK